MRLLLYKLGSTGRVHRPPHAHSFHPKSAPVFQVPSVNDDRSLTTPIPCKDFLLLVSVHMSMGLVCVDGLHMQVIRPPLPSTAKLVAYESSQLEVTTRSRVRISPIDTYRGFREQRGSSIKQADRQRGLLLTRIKSHTSVFLYLARTLARFQIDIILDSR
ncbi:hypothetical protein VNO77_03466 [Canavalia gladiata]|uniref:Uncharacterized protein n=1 Tax=Canavalia gladiata TaxID=3824 RepID=A0AAN9MZS0_CANGL